MIPSGGYSADLARYGIDSKHNENILKKVEKLAENYSATNIKEEILTALKNKDTEKLSEINKKLPNFQEANAYNKYLEQNSEVVDEDKKFQFYKNSYQDLDNNLWFTHQLSMQDTYKEYDTSIDTHHMAGAASSVHLAIILMETKPDSVFSGTIETSESKKFTKEIFKKILGINSSIQENKKGNFVKEPKSLNQIFNERLEFFNSDDETISARIGPTTGTEETHEHRLNRYKYIYDKNVEYLNTFKDYLLKFDMIEPDEKKNDRLLDVKA